MKYVKIETNFIELLEYFKIFNNIFLVLIKYNKVHPCRAKEVEKEGT